MQKEIIDFSKSWHVDALKEAYDEVYMPAFPVDNEREPLSKWMARLAADHPNNRITQYAIALTGHHLDDSHRRFITGVAVGVYYREAAIGLLAYNAVRPEARGEGVGKELVKARIEAFDRDARYDGRVLEGVVLEIHDPKKISAEMDTMDPAVRLEIYQKMGAVVLPIDYTPPSLSTDQDQQANLCLLSMPGPQGQYASPAALTTFIRSMYLTLGDKNPEENPQFQAMRDQLDGLEILSGRGKAKPTLTEPRPS